MQHNIYLYIMVSALVSFAVRAVPLTLIRKKIENPFLKSFLFYVPYVTLSVMTFPAIVETTAVPIAGVLALAAGRSGRPFMNKTKLRSNDARNVRFCEWASSEL